MSELEAAKAVIRRLRDHGAVALLAGGCVRDQLLGKVPKDYDVATDATPDAICRLFRRTRQVGAQFGVVLVRERGSEIEVATFRTDADYVDGRRPVAVHFASPEQDARRRDFTINGMFFDPFEERLVDYVGGREDLQRGLVRCIGTPDQRFAEDHLRMLRAVRFAARLNFDIESATFRAIQDHAPQIAAISAERIRMELEMILTHPRRARGWRLIVDSKLAQHLVADTDWSPAAADRTERILAALPDIASVQLALAAIALDASVVTPETFGQRLRCSVAVTRAIAWLVRTAPLAAQRTDWELADVKQLRASGLFEELIALARAISLADNLEQSSVDRLAERGRALSDEAAAPPPLIGGDDLIARQVRPGPRFKTILERLYRAQLNESITTREAAEAMLDDILQEE